ncbi:unnamed protein product [Clonostachys rosea]|uniref:Uncharacterized protein n=1 Tax=Bionectria ochroleuca TaxID=29856 RepID=A0ABY6UKQ4_BIOOC|nr:unnamed protein product [Clonostachys rosea]
MPSDTPIRSSHSTLLSLMARKAYLNMAKLEQVYLHHLFIRTDAVTSDEVRNQVEYLTWDTEDWTPENHPLFVARNQSIVAFLERWVSISERCRWSAERNADLWKEEKGAEEEGEEEEEEEEEGGGATTRSPSRASTETVAETKAAPQAYSIVNAYQVVQLMAHIERFEHFEMQMKQSIHNEKQKLARKDLREEPAISQMMRLGKYARVMMMKSHGRKSKLRHCVSVDEV